MKLCRWTQQQKDELMPLHPDNATELVHNNDDLYPLFKPTRAFHVTFRLSPEDEQMQRQRIIHIIKMMTLPEAIPIFPPNLTVSDFPMSMQILNALT